MGGGPPDFPQGSTCLAVLWILLPPPTFAYGALTLSGRPSQAVLLMLWLAFMQSVTPVCTHTGLGSPGFARRYSRVRCFFLFLRLLRCFSSPGLPPCVMDWRMDAGGLLQRVSPFRDPRIDGYVPLPVAYRSLSRLSSALSAKASTLRSFLLDQMTFACGCRLLI